MTPLLAFSEPDLLTSDDTLKVQDQCPLSFCLMHKTDKCNNCSKALIAANNKTELTVKILMLLSHQFEVEGPEAVSFEMLMHNSYAAVATLRCLSFAECAFDNISV